MTIQSCFHARAGAEFLGLRISRRGEVEVVYDNGDKARHIWRVITGGLAACDMTLADETRLTDALRLAANAPRVLPSLHREMKKRAITLEVAAQ